MWSTYYFEAGTEINVVVGQAGNGGRSVSGNSVFNLIVPESPIDGNTGGAGGGCVPQQLDKLICWLGGTFVYLDEEFEPLLVAGGGGGASYYTYSLPFCWCEIFMLELTCEGGGDGRIGECGDDGRNSLYAGFRGCDGNVCFFVVLQT